MATLRTEITEITTGLAMLGFRDLDTALDVEPAAIAHVTAEHFARLRAARSGGEFNGQFATAWDNGTTFARAKEALRGRPPWVVEWKGEHKPPGYEQIPADLRVDHVYLVSCKYGSNILHNLAPAHLFERLLTDRTGRRTDWFLEVAPETYQDLYEACRSHLGDSALPERVGDIAPEHRRILKAGLKGRWSSEIQPLYRALAYEVARQSAERWSQRLDSEGRREQMVWRLLRFQASPYFVLGASIEGSPLRYRVATPWDFRERYRLLQFGVWPDVAGQPTVRWRIEAADVSTGNRHEVEGHVEIRWSHGRFGQVPEAKVYLDTPHAAVPGYFPLGD